MMKILVLTIAIWLILVSCGESSPVAKRGQRKLCGQMLTQTLSLLCNGQYYDPEENTVIRTRDVGFQMGAELPRSWYFGPPYPRTDDRGRRPFEQRQQRGVADECCAQPCSVSVLLSYCRPPPGDRD